MTEFFIAPIVEGHGEVQAVPILLQRAASEIGENIRVLVNPPLRIKADSFRNDTAYFERYFELAARKAKQHRNGSILILLDCDDECPGEIDPRLTQRAIQTRGDVKVTVALAYREYETWFLAAAKSLRGVAGMPDGLMPPDDPEAVRNAKGWIEAQMPNGYNEPNDQPRLTARFSFDEAAHVPSFARLRAKLHQLFAG